MTSVYAGGIGKEDGYTYEIDEYDVFNRLVEVTNENSIAQYTYKPNDMRLSKTVDNVETIHIWDGSNIVMDLSGNEIVDRYTRGINLIKSDNSGYYVYNAHGDVSSLVDDLGVVTKTYDYDAFGVEINPDSGDTNPWRYCGEYFDTETEMIYLRHRSYNPSNGRFTREDPIRFGLNWYTYASGNPLSFKEPWGLADTLASLESEYKQTATAYSEAQQARSKALSSYNSNMSFYNSGIKAGGDAGSTKVCLARANAAWANMVTAENTMSSLAIKMQSI